MDWLRLPDGETRRVLDLGAGSPIVFVPMLPHLNVLYVPQLRRLSSRGARVITYDPVIRASDRLSVSDRSRELVQLVDALEIARCDLFAWSDTGAVACRFAVDWPNRCRSLILTVLPDRYELPLPLAVLTGLLSKLPVERWVPSWLVAQILGIYMSGPTVKAAWIREYARRIPKLCAVFKWSCLPNLREHFVPPQAIKLPALIISGDTDKVVPVMRAERLREALPGAHRLIVLKGGEHLITYANADDVNEAVLGFLAELRSQDSR